MRSPAEYMPNLALLYAAAPEDTLLPTMPAPPWFDVVTNEADLQDDDEGEVDDG